MYLYTILELKVKYPNASYDSHLNVISSCRLDLFRDNPPLHNMIAWAQSEASKAEVACIRKKQNRSTKKKKKISCNQENSAADEKLWIFP